MESLITTIFKMITDKLNEGVIEIPKERIEECNSSMKVHSKITSWWRCG